MLQEGTGIVYPKVDTRTEQPTTGRGKVLALDQLGGIHPESFGQLFDCSHTRVSYFSPLQAADVIPVRAALLGQLLPAYEPPLSQSPYDGPLGRGILRGVPAL
jgi:hypothetical protein